ncbi:MAG: hypothetical protein JWR69_3053 [Pedosphaera sp.]|nr:hypothetical protein [Pedosphaera sp.]
MLDHAGPMRANHITTMAHPHDGSLPAPDFFAHTKILFSEWPGKVAVLVESGAQTPMEFEGPHQALDWCVEHRATFYYLPPESGSQN